MLIVNDYNRQILSVAATVDFESDPTEKATAKNDLGFDMQVDRQPDQARKDSADTFQVHGDRRVKSWYAKELFYRAKTNNERNTVKHKICRKASDRSRYRKSEKKKALH